MQEEKTEIVKLNFVYKIWALDWDLDEGSNVLN